MSRIIFNYKGNKYYLSFYPCGNMGNIEKIGGKFSHDFKYDKNTTVKTFLLFLDRIQFN